MEYLIVLKKEINKNSIEVQEKGTQGRKRKSVRSRTREQEQKNKDQRKEKDTIK